MRTTMAAFLATTALCLFGCSDVPTIPVNQAEPPEPDPPAGFPYDAMGQGTFWIRSAGYASSLIDTRARSTTTKKISVGYNPHMSPDATQVLYDVPVGDK